MATGVNTAAEAAVRKVLAPLCALSGALVVVGFFFPQFVSSVLSGRGWLLVSLFFFCSGLAYLALLPIEGEAGRAEVPYLLRVRHLSVVRTLRGFLGRQDRLTFGVPVAVFGLFFVAQALAPSATTAAVSVLEGIVLSELGWLFLGAVFVAVVYAFALLLGPWGDVRLGPPDAEPAYTYPTYFTMFFTAGIAAGIVFWGPAEALFHYRTPPPALAVEPRSAAAITGALTYTLFHWGVSAWSAYLAIGLPIAYFAYNRGAPLRVLTILTPLVGVDGLGSRWARLVDVLAVFATIGGIATSIALVSRQFLAGIGYQWAVTVSSVAPVVVVAGLTLISVVSAESGVRRGIRRIAGANLALFVLFGLLLSLVAPRSFVAEQGTAALGRYVVEFAPMSLTVGGEWVADWTVWNWSWWFSWAPFAGLFLAALSRGRRIRTVVFTSVVATAAATMAWFLLVGGTTLYVQHTDRADVLAQVTGSAAAEAVAGFPVLSALPLGRVLLFLFLALIILFMVSSADTSTLVVSILTTRRDLAPTTGSIVFWGVLQGGVALSVLLVGGGEALQAIAVLTGGPFAVLSLVALAGLSVTFWRRERGHRSLVRRAFDAIDAHDVSGPSDVFRDEK